MITINEKCIDTCNKLLRGELSAIETYEQAIEKFQDSAESTALGNIRADHQNSAVTISNHIISMGGVPSTDSGVWGGFVQALEGTAKLLGESPTLQLLQKGEDHGIKEYQDALENPDVMEEFKQTIRTELLPPLHEHIAGLQRIQVK